MMTILLIIVGSVLGLIVLFVVWRLIATVRATGKRDRLIYGHVAPIVDALNAGLTPDEKEIARLAQRKDTRRALYEALKEHGKEAHFPRRYLNVEAAAEADMVYWLLHPNELGSAPDEIELMTRVKRREEGVEIEYFVYRYRMHEPHWAAADGWTVGISGPYLEGSPLYSWAPGTFSTFEKYDSKTPDEHVDWVHDTMMNKGMYRDLLSEGRNTPE